MTHHDGILETCHFKGPFLNKKKSTREKKLIINHKHGSIPKYFNKNIYTSKSGLPKVAFIIHKPIVNSVLFVDPYYHINTMDNKNEATHLVNSNE